MWKLKGCPRCGRDIFVYQGINGQPQQECFRCGYRVRLGSTVDRKERDSQEKREPSR